MGLAAVRATVLHRNFRKVTVWGLLALLAPGVVFGLGGVHAPEVGYRLAAWGVTGGCAVFGGPVHRRGPRQCRSGNSTDNPGMPYAGAAAGHQFRSRVQNRPGTRAEEATVRTGPIVQVAAAASAGAIPNVRCSPTARDVGQLRLPASSEQQQTPALWWLPGSAGRH